jgi:hypothetical protein
MTFTDLEKYRIKRKKILKKLLPFQMCDVIYGRPFNFIYFLKMLDNLKFFEIYIKL